MLSRETFKNGIAGMCELFGHELSKASARLYYEAVKDLTDDEFNQAVGRVIRTRKFRNLPMPGELISSISEDPDIAASMALARVEKAMREIGAYKSVIFEDPAITATISVFDGAWTGICAMPEQEWKFARKDFLRLYKGFIGRRMNVQERLIGIEEHQNSQAGYLDRIPDPVRIGSGGMKYVPLGTGEGDDQIQRSS